ncbi:hypothetical protein DEI86_14760 [Curtobacterium sp. MCBD17_028]|nr:hypothetical protein DEI86_14760 [Curtobacterium sp. MCBD17_028]
MGPGGRGRGLNRTSRPVCPPFCRHSCWGWGGWDALRRLDRVPPLPGSGDVPVSLPAAGWFPDPADATRLRWWDGRTWGSATQAPALADRTLAPTTPESVAPHFSVTSQDLDEHGWACGSRTGSIALTPGGRFSVHAARRFCLFGWGSLALALLALVVDPFGIVSLLAVVAAIAGIARPRATGVWRVAARSMAFTAAVLGIMTLALAASQLTGAVPA